MAIFSPVGNKAEAEVARLIPDGGAISYTGYGPANADVYLSVSTSFDTGVHGNSITFKGVSVGEDSYYRITVSPADSITITSPNIPIPFLSKTVEAVGSTVTWEVGKIEVFPGWVINGTYDVTVTVQPQGASTVNVELVAKYKTDGSGLYTAALSTDGLPDGTYTILQDGTAVAKAYIGYATCDLNLAQGWNLFSLPIAPVESDVTAVFTQDQLDNIDVLWDYSGGDWRFYSTNPSYADDPRKLASMALDVQKGYYAYCNQPMTVKLIGNVGTGAIPLSALPDNSWNLVGYPTTSTQNVSNQYGGADVVYEFDDGWRWFTNVYDQCNGPLTDLRPGYGYWVLT